ncbi:hypothetical protein [Aliidiomarina haloalkalitolerans]|uniref:Type II secretory pathway component n=1 Tax=Aliidiomarina haloalkalitolerans TaxID=859059 RepID=A0A432VSQ6_9GAMM|nr:hypothetical protein [Aliidiomarina haloalkalitolerans]RUO19427.1 hypothetical protein CWE06_07790 [Aliidiomarina haloalkalitolerans]
MRLTNKAFMHRSQHGGALPIAIFIIVVMSLLGLTMMRILADVSSATVAEVFGTRAEAAASSGLEIALTNIFPLNDDVNLTYCTVRGTSPAITHQYDFNVTGLLNCSAIIECNYFDIPDPYRGYNFRIESIGSCEAGNQTYSRRILLEATDEIY